MGIVRGIRFQVGCCRQTGNRFDKDFYKFCFYGDQWDRSLKFLLHAGSHTIVYTGHHYHHFPNLSPEHLNNPYSAYLVLHNPHCKNLNHQNA
jgi:hypothetical protein